MSEQAEKKTGAFNRMLDGIERFGNKMCDPATMFLVLTAIVLVVSCICGLCNVQAVNPATGDVIVAQNLISRDGFRKLWSEAVAQYQAFPSLAMVLVTMLGVGVADKTGLLTVSIRRLLQRVPKKLVTAMVVMVGICANAAGDAGFYIYPPLVGLIYLGLGRNPILGLLTAFGSLCAGFTATFFPAIGDVLCYGFTLPAAQVLDPNYVASPMLNYYFTFVSVFLLTIVGTFVSEKIIAPRFGEYDKSQLDPDDQMNLNITELTDDQKKGLKWSGISLLIAFAVLVFLCVGPGKLLADDQTGGLTTSNAPFMKGIVLSITLLFLIPGIVYGVITKQIKRDTDVVKLMAQSLNGMTPFLVLIFFVAQFMAVFNWSNLGVIISIKGAELLKNIGLTGIPLLVVFILVSSLLNLFTASQSAKWAIMAPIFVPMMMLLGYDPAVTQCAYRIGDSITNCLTPLFIAVPICVGFINRYDKKAGLGTVIANMIPFSLVMGVIWIIFFAIWISLGIPLGPGAGIVYTLPGA